MAQITIRELSDKAKEALRVQAAQSGLSLESMSAKFSSKLPQARD